MERIVASKKYIMMRWLSFGLLRLIVIRTPAFFASYCRRQGHLLGKSLLYMILVLF